MILIALNWIILLLFFIPSGIAAEHLLRINSNKISITILIGMIFQTVLLTICAFFTSIGLSIFIANLILSILLIINHRKQLQAKYTYFTSEFTMLSSYLKITLLIILISVLLKSAALPFILDNESYYVQTIKWLNEYGFVKGLANLNSILGQTSGWHILQSGFNFSFLTNRINDINGFLLVVCSFYFTAEFDQKWKKNHEYHWIGFVLLFNVLFYQFVNSPSPDLPLFLIAQIIFYNFLKNGKTIENQKIIIVFFGYLMFLKITIAPLCFMMIYQFYHVKKTRVFMGSILFLFAALWVAKNTILTGYPLFSITYFQYNCDWKVPETLVNTLNYAIQNHEFLSVSKIKNLSILEKFYIWIQLDGINRIFNIGMLLLFILAPFTKKIRTLLKYKVLYVLLLIHFVVVFLSSPQFRFFLVDFIFLGVLLFAAILNRLKINYQFVKAILLFAVTLPFIAIYFINLKSLTKNKHNQTFEKITFSQLYLPEKNSKYSDIEFEKIKEGNLIYNSPKENFFMYGAADGELPCINQVQINYKKKTSHYVPQLRTGDLGDGFYSKNTIENE